MLRNLNQSFPRGRICGMPRSGLRGSQIAASGDHGPGYAYSSLSLPADANNEISAYIETLPSAGTLFANEDTSFTFTAPDGSYSFQYRLRVNGVPSAQLATVKMTVGFGVGEGVADGVAAFVTNPLMIQLSVANAVAGGLTAGINAAVMVSAGVGNAIAGTMTAQVQSGGTNVIQGAVGNATANGETARIDGSRTISAFVGDSFAGGSLARILNASAGIIGCAVGTAEAYGLQALLAQESRISCSAGNAVADGYHVIPRIVVAAKVAHLGYLRAGIRVQR